MGVGAALGADVGEDRGQRTEGGGRRMGDVFRGKGGAGTGRKGGRELGDRLAGVGLARGFVAALPPVSG